MEKYIPKEITLTEYFANDREGNLAKEIKLKQVDRTRVWEPEEDKILKEQIEAGKLPSQIVVSGRSSRAIDHRISKLRKLGEIDKNFAKPWTQEEDQVLINQLNSGKTIDKVEIPGRTPDQAYARLKKLRNKEIQINFTKRLRPQQVVARERKAQVEENKKRQKARLDQLKSLLNNEGRFWPSAKVAEHLGVKQDWVGRWRKRLGLELKHEEAVFDPDYRENHKLQIAKRLEAKALKKQKAKEEAKRARQEAIYKYELFLGKMSQRFAQLSQQRYPGKMTSCSKCGRVWYLSKEFFGSSGFCKACEKFPNL